MEQLKVEMFMTTNSDKLPADKLLIVKEHLEALPDEKLILLQSMEMKNPTTLLLISIFLGSWGIDRFMLGDTGLGVLKLLTAGCCGVLTIIDWFTVMDRTREQNFLKLMQVM